MSKQKSKTNDKAGKASTGTTKTKAAPRATTNGLITITIDGKEIKCEAGRNLVDVADLDVRGKRVLDLGSHDGHWCWAALECGAEYVLGIEGRRELVERLPATEPAVNAMLDGLEAAAGPSSCLLGSMVSACSSTGQAVRLSQPGRVSPA